VTVSTGLSNDGRSDEAACHPSHVAPTALTLSLPPSFSAEDGDTLLFAVCAS
jgi:hypothetical protein